MILNAKYVKDTEEGINVGIGAVSVKAVVFYRGGRGGTLRQAEILEGKWFH
jgi:hypothetical protein